MKTSKTPIQLAKNASKLHKKVGELLTSNDFFKNYEIRQEYSVSRVNPTYKSNREKFDWAILGLKVIIEVHGIQHFKPVCFGGMEIDEAKKIFRKRQEVDHKKENAAREAGWAFVVVKYSEPKIGQAELTERILGALESVSEESAQKEFNITKAKIQNRGFQKPQGGYKWPTRKIQNRKLR